jgi:hypothetical protein
MGNNDLLELLRIRCNEVLSTKIQESQHRRSNARLSIFLR